MMTFTFQSDKHAMFKVQCWGTDPYTPGRRSRALLGDILSWGLDAVAVRYALRHQGAVLITNLPTDDDLPLTPVDGKRPTNKYTMISECLLNGFSQLLKMHPVAFHNEKDGDLIHQIAAQPGKEASPSNAGADCFNLHTEATHMDFPPNVLALVCLRNSEHGMTNFTSLDASMEGSFPGLIAELRKPNFTQSMGVSSGGWGKRYPLAIINGPEDDPIYRVDFTDVEATTEDAQRALDYLKAVAHLNEKRVDLQPGDLLLVNNHKSLHGRVGFTPDYSQGRHRWLQRQYMTANPQAGTAHDDRFPHVWAG